MNILFINGSPNKDGNTVHLAKALLAGQVYDTFHLADYKIYCYGQSYDDDELPKMLTAMQQADTIVIGSPVFWHNMSGAVRNLLDRLYGALDKRVMRGKRLFFLFQGVAPDRWMIEAGEYSIKIFAQLYGLDYMGMATTVAQAKELAQKL